jgi:hypothetical protein
VVFCIFSGWDVVGGAEYSGLRTFATGAPFELPADIEWWDKLFQYSSTMTLAFWVPHHALAGWFFTAILLLWDRHRIGIAAVVMSAGLAICWSPFALMGALPFLVKAGIEALRRGGPKPIECGVVLLLAIALVPMAIYLTSDAGTVVRGFQTIDTEFVIRYIEFIALEILPFIVINAKFSNHEYGFSKSTYYIAIVLLLLMPFYKINVSNDFVMRASVPSLAILAVTTGHTAYRVLSAGRYVRSISVIVVLGLGSLTGIDEICLF